MKKKLSKNWFARTFLGCGRTTTMCRECVKTQKIFNPKKIGLPNQAPFNYFDVRNGFPTLDFLKIFLIQFATELEFDSVVAAPENAEDALAFTTVAPKYLEYGSAFSKNCYITAELSSLPLKYPFVSPHHRFLSRHFIFNFFKNFQISILPFRFFSTIDPVTISVGIDSAIYFKMLHTVNNRCLRTTWIMADCLTDDCNIWYNIATLFSLGIWISQSSV